MLNIFRYRNGLQLIPVSSLSLNQMGELQVLSSDGKLYYYDGTIASPFVTEAGSTTITNKTISGSSNTFSNIANASLSNMAAHTFKGNNTGSPAAPIDLTATQLTAELNSFVGDSGSGGTKGLVPAPASGDAAANKYLKADGTWTFAGTGSATSVALTAPNIFSVSGSPVTTSGTLALSFVSQSQNLVLASPNGSSGVPTFRALVAADIPTLNQNTTGSAAKWTTARLLAGNSVDGSTDVPFANKFIVQGTTDSGLSSAQFLGALGTGIVKNTTTTGVLSIAVAGDFPTLNQNTTGTASNVTGVVAIANGGTNNGSLAVTAGGVLYTDGSKVVNVGAGSSGQFLKSNGASAPAWTTITVTGMPGTNWANDLTFTTSASMGTLTNSNFFYRRVGDSIEVRADFTLGTTTAATATISLPGGIVIDSTKIPSNASGTRVGFATDVGGSSSPLFVSSITSQIFYDGSDTAKVYFSYQSDGSGHFTKNNANNLWNANEQLSLTFSVPIVAYAF